ncbi:hypothetical protein MTR_0019s0110 [Medicago truncatula]|uniref:Uncharacterized protein n=1 Tax=Medicago truncatula TaxID=3880 RepID=A0A072TKL0_MEDTR|nr:hypothetical protein MTR_0019s0110 [Medicago truncatula]
MTHHLLPSAKRSITHEPISTHEPRNQTPHKSGNPQEPINQAKWDYIPCSNNLVPQGESSVLLKSLDIFPKTQAYKSMSGRERRKAYSEVRNIRSRE